MRLNKNLQKKVKKQQSSPLKPSNNPTAQSVAQIFSATRDFQVQNPYHMDGDAQMYNEQNTKLRQQLSKDQDIKKQIDQIIKLYKFDSQNCLIQQNYKKVQKQLALILRPDIDQQQLQFVVQQDWQYDQKDNFIKKEDLNGKIFQLIDIWSIGVNKQQYISFAKLLRKKLKRALENPSSFNNNSKLKSK